MWNLWQRWNSRFTGRAVSTRRCSATSAVDLPEAHSRTPQGGGSDAGLEAGRVGWVTGVDPVNPVASLNAYELRRLGEHLEAAGDADGLERLLALEWRVEASAAPDRAGRQSSRWWRRWGSRRALDVQPTIVRHRNAWYEAKNATGDAAGYRDDVERARRLASRACAEAARTDARVPIERELRCALLAASINSFGSRLPGAVLRALVERGVWDESNALAYAARDRSKILALLPALATETREEALRGFLAGAPRRDSRPIYDVAAFLNEPQVLSALQDGPGHPDLPVKSGMFARLASRLIELGRVELALEVVQDHVSNRFDAVQVLAELAPHLDEAQARQALETARGWDDIGDRQYAFAAVYPRLAALGHVTEALDVAAEIESAFSRVEMLSRLAPALDLEGCRQALTMVPGPEHDEPYGRAKALLALGASATRLGDEAWGATMIDDAVTTIAGVRLHDFERIVSTLAGERPKAALQIADGFEDRAERMVALAAVAPHLPPELGDLARQAAMRDADEWTLSDPDELVALSAFDPDRVVEIVRARWRGSIGDDAAVARLAPGLPARALAQLRDIVAQVLDDGPRTKARAALDAELAALGDPLALERLAAAEPTDVRSAELAAIAPRLPEDLLSRAIEVLAELPDVDQELPARTLAVRMTDDQLRTLLDDAARRASDQSYAVLVSACSEHLSASMVDRALELALGRRDQYWRERAAIALAPRVDVHQLARMRKRVPPGRRYFDFQHLECAVAIRLAQLGRTAEALKVATEIEQEDRLVEAIRGMAPHLSGVDELRRVERLAQAVRAPGERADAFGVLSNCTTEPDRTRLRRLAIADAEKASVDDIAAARTDESPRQPNPTAMARLARELGEDVYERAQAVAKSTAREEDRISAIGQLGPLEGAALEGTLGLAREIENPRGRDEAFAAVLGSTRCPSAELVAETLRACTAEGTYISNPQHERLRLVATHLQRYGPEIAHEQLSGTLPLLASRGRQELAAFIRALAPLIGSLGGLEAIRRTEGAIEDVARWWP
jgi:hypothetical protein